MRKLFIGHTRFSVYQYKSGSFRATRGGDGGIFSEEEYTNWLYGDERLGQRTEIFVEESLPQLAASAEASDVVHIVHYSPSLPQKYQKILQEAAEEYPFVHLNEAPGVVAPSAPSKKVLNTVLRGKLPEDGVFGLYRLDDDDVLPINFFERMSPYVVDEHVGWRISFPDSLTAVRTVSEYIYPWRRNFPKAAAGLLSIHQRTADGSFLGLQTRTPAKGHMKLDTAYPVVLDSREPGFFQARHKSQDSKLGPAEAPYFGPLISAATEKEHVPADLFEDYFPFVSRRIRRSIAQAARRLPLEPSASLDLEAGVTVRIDSSSSHMLLVEIGRSADAVPAIEIDISVARGGGIGETAMDVYMSAAGLTRVAPDVYRGAVAFNRDVELGTCVLETPNGCSVLNVRLHADQAIQVKSLSSYLLD